MAVIGGGVVVLERSEHTCGSTPHAAGAMHTFNTAPNVAKLHDCTRKIDNEIEEVSGHSCAIHLTGGLMSAATQARLDDLNTARARGRYLGLDTEFVDLREAARMLPIMDPRHYVDIVKRHRANP